MSTQPMMFPSGWSERMAYERAKAGYWPYDIEDLRHFCALRDLRIEELKADNAKLRELCEKLYGYYVSGTLAPCDFCDRYDCEGTVPTTCKADEYDPDGMVVEEIERCMRELGITEAD